MIKILEKLALARVHIKAHPIKKDGKNTFSNYDYFSPELVGKMVTDACVEANIICVFNLKKDEMGFFGELIVTDLETGESLTSIMRTEKPVLKATNETQQMGGMNTYTKRYCLMSLFDIEDNTIDFDSDSSSKKTDTTKQNGNTLYNHKPLVTGAKPLITNILFKKACDRMRAGEIGVYEKTINAFSFEPGQRRAFDSLNHELNQPA